MTDESWNLDITKLTFQDLRPRTRRHNRRSGWKPPPTINVNITATAYDLVRSLALARGQRHSPFYEEVDKFVEEYLYYRKGYEEKSMFLDMAIEDKKKMREELEALKKLT